MHVMHKRMAALGLAAGLLTLIAGCGGGGGGAGDSTGGNSTSPGTTSFPPYQTLAAQCTAPRTGGDPFNNNLPYPDRQGTLDNEKAWLRSFFDQTYLWYNEVPSVSAASYTQGVYGSVFNTMTAYFNALKTPTRTPSGRLTDQFSFTVTTSEWNNSTIAGVQAGYGIRFRFIQNTPPRLLRVAYVEPNSPGANAGITRGDTILSVDGVDLVNGSDVTTLNNGLSPVPGKTTTFGVLSVGAATSRNVTITSSSNVRITPVPTNNVISANGRSVGYLVLNTFSNVNAEADLFNAFTALRNANVQDLVLDLRYNGGGYVDLSSELGYMIAGNTVAGRTFETTVCNNRNPFSICNSTVPFYSTAPGFFSVSRGTPLPTLNLPRVFVLQTSATCSASESLINGLTPFVQVIKIGSTTCGKPYGFYVTDNCGTSYAAIQFKGANANGFGDFADGLPQTCQVADDLSKQRGDPTELMLAGALNYIRTGQCPPASTGVLKASKLADEGYLMRSPLEEIKIMNPPGQGMNVNRQLPR